MDFFWHNDTMVLTLPQQYYVRSNNATFKAIPRKLVRFREKAIFQNGSRLLVGCNSLFYE